MVMVTIPGSCSYCTDWKICFNYWSNQDFRVIIFLINLTQYRLFGYNSGIGIRELSFISYAGMIRGAIAFGLVLKIDHDVENRSVIITTSLALVVFTTVFMGSTVALFQRCLFGKEVATPHAHHETHSKAD